jgi:MFS family permease
MVYVLSLLQGIVTAIDNPARHSFFAEMVGSEHLTNAISLNSAVMTGTRIVGPALAGLLIASVGIAACFLVNGASYVAVIGVSRDALRGPALDDPLRDGGLRQGSGTARVPGCL